MGTVTHTQNPCRGEACLARGPGMPGPYKTVARTRNPHGAPSRARRIPVGPAARTQNPRGDRRAHAEFPWGPSGAR